MQQVTDGVLNINVMGNNPAVPSTGFWLGDITNAIGSTGCFLIVTAMILVLLAAAFFCLRRRLKHLRFLPAAVTALVALAVGLTAPAIATTVNANFGSNVTDLNVTLKPNETVTATANATVNIGNIDRAHMVYAYMDGSNMLVNTLNPASVIVATDPTSSSDPNALTTNSYGIKNSTNGTYQPISTDPQHPTVLYTNDQSTTGSTVDLTYAIKLDDTIAAGTYTNAKNSNKIKYVAEPQHTYNLNYDSTATPSHMPQNVSYGPAPVLEHSFTIPSGTDNIPTRTDGTTFIGWCDGTLTAEDTCDGKVYQPGDSINLSLDPAKDIDTTTTLHAMWQRVTLKYDPNGGMDPPIDQPLPEGAVVPYTFQISYTQPTRLGYTFKNWNTKPDGTGVSYNSGDPITIGSTTTLYATWEAYHRTITYKSYDGNTTYGTQEFVYDTPQQMRAHNAGSGWAIQPVAPDGKGFIGWTTTKGSINPEYADQATINDLINDTVVYATWSQDLNLYFNQADGTTENINKTIYNGATSTTYDAPVVADRTGDTPSRTVVGWGDTDIATTSAIDSGATGQTISQDNNNSEYYAVYNYPVTAHYDANGGSGATNDTTCTAHSTAMKGMSGFNNTACTMTLANNSFTREGYDFSKWAEGSATGDQYAAGATRNLDTDTTYYAIWNAQPRTITIQSNNSSYGTVSPTTITAKYDSTITTGGNVMTVDAGTAAAQSSTATPTTAETGYTNQLDNWDTSSCGATLTTDCTVTANFTHNANTYSISYDLDGGTAGESAPTTGTYDSDLTISNPTKTDHIFKGWTITGMDNVTHYYGDSSSSYTTTTATSLTGIKGTAFKNLRATSGTVTFKAIWGFTFDSAFAAAGKTKDPTSNLYKMQDMETSICSAVEPPTSATAHDEQTTTLVDTRDGKTYQVGKLMDGNCWMQENLRLGSESTSYNLTENDTNLTSGTTFTLPAMSTSTPWTESYSAPYLYPSDDQDTTSTGYHGYYGYYYNYNAASAGTDNGTGTSELTSDICPKGWSMPSNYTVNPNRSYSKLLYSYDVIPEITSSGTGYADDGYAKMTSAPLNFVLSGHHDASGVSVDGRGSNGYYWSSSDYSAMYAHINFFNSSNVGPRDGNNKYYGDVIRCLAK